MTPVTNIVDLALHRKRRNAQQLGRALWALYAQNAGMAVQAVFTSPSRVDTPRHA